jgi:hypothetical protein
MVPLSRGLRLTTGLVTLLLRILQPLFNPKVNPQMHLNPEKTNRRARLETRRQATPDFWLNTSDFASSIRFHPTGNECAPTQIFQHEYYFRLTGNNIGDPDRLMVQAFTYSKNISLSPLESRRHEQERKREILHPSHLVSAGEPTNNFAFTSRYRVSENTQNRFPTGFNLAQIL